MKVLVGLMMVLVGLLFLWAFSAILISAIAGLVVTGLLWLLLHLLRRTQLQRAYRANPALDLEQALQRPPLWMQLGKAFAVWLGCAAMLAALLQLPENLYSPDQLVLAAGIVYLASLWALFKCIGNLLSLNETPEEATQTQALWSLIASLIPMLSLVVWIFFIPHTAGWMVWREEARGYYSTQLRIALNNDDAEHRQALLTLVQPLLEQGSQVMRYTSRSRGGSSYTLRAALPARYRFEEGALLVQMAGVMPKHQLEQHLQLIDAVSQGAFPGALGLLQGQLTVRPPQTTSFSPWWSKGRWQAVALPEEDELATLNGL